MADDTHRNEPVKRSPVRRVYVAVRWRVVGRFTKLRWTLRRLRSRIIGQVRKLGWAYRGIRWRVIGRFHKMMWFGRRRRSYILSVTSRARWTLRGALAPVAAYVSMVKASASATAVSGLTFADRRSIVRESRTSFNEIVNAIELTPPPANGTLFPKGMRLRTLLFAGLRGPETASAQYLTVEVPQTLNRALQDQLSDHRFIVIDAKNAHVSDVSTLVVMLLVSGRPVVVGPTTVSALDEFVAPLRMEEATVGHLLGCAESELSAIALAQLRALMLAIPPSVESASVPIVSVAMSTNRPELVQEAVQRIQAQEHIDVELFIGCHGFPASDVAGTNLVRGAVRSAKVQSFEADEVFGDVLRQLSEQATSKWIAKWDDDDLYGRHHLFDLWMFARLSRSALVGKAAEYVLLENRGLLIRRRGGPPYRNTSFLAGGALMMSTDVLRSIGSWASIPRSVDQNIIRRFESAGFPAFRIHGKEFVLVRHDRGHTWEAGADYFENAADEIYDASAVWRSDITERPAPESIGGHTPVDMSLSICVPNKDNLTSVRLFEAMLASAPPSTTLVISDDRSDPPLTLRGEIGATLVRSPVRDGFGAGRSRQCAADSATGGILVFADSDMYLESDVFERTLRRFNRGFVGALHAEISFSQLVGDDVRQIFLGGESPAMVSERLSKAELFGQAWRDRHWAESADYHEPQSSTYCGTVGAFVAIDRASFDRSGGFRDIPVRGVEDTEFGYRLMVSGCEQRLDRDGGIWHLGERTFADRLGSDEEEIRETYLSALVPIWTRNLSERRAALHAWSESVVPFVEVADPEVAAQLDSAFGVAAVSAAAAHSVLDAPFAVGSEIDPAYAAGAANAAFIAFRDKRCGEVVVMSDGATVGRFTALWAANLSARRQGSEALYLGADDLGAVDELTSAIRRDFGALIVTLK